MLRRCKCATPCPTVVRDAYFLVLQICLKHSRERVGGVPRQRYINGFSWKNLTDVKIWRAWNNVKAVPREGTSGNVCKFDFGAQHKWQICFKRVLFRVGVLILNQTVFKPSVDENKLFSEPDVDKSFTCRGAFVRQPSPQKMPRLGI